MKSISKLWILATLFALILAGCRIRILSDPSAADEILSTTKVLQTEPHTLPDEETDPPVTTPPAEPSDLPETEPSAAADPAETDPLAETDIPKPIESKPQPSPGGNPTSSGSGGKETTQQVPSSPSAAPEEPVTTEPVVPGSLTVTVSFDPNGGDSPLCLTEVTPGASYGPLPEAVWRGHIFSGWWTLPEDGERVFSDTTVETAEDHILYAHWLKADSFQVFFDPNGGRIKSRDSRMELSYGQSFGTLPKPILEGYAFLGWFTAPADGVEITESTVFEETKDITLYAHWQYDPQAYWRFILQNRVQQVYLCQQASIYFETVEDHVTQVSVDLITSTGSQNIAQCLSDPNTTDDWVLAKNPQVILKCVSSIAQQDRVLASMSERFPGKRLFLVTQAALGDDVSGLYARLFLAKALYADFFADVDLAAAAAELGIGESPILVFDLP